MPEAADRVRQAGPAEFDSYARDYSAGMENRVKQMFGNAADDFVAVKLRWLYRECRGLCSAKESFRVLDYGCGTGTLLLSICPPIPASRSLKRPKPPGPTVFW